MINHAAFRYIFIILVILILLSLGLIYLYSPKNLDENLWVTFTDPINKITFEVNRNWKITSSSNQFIRISGDNLSILITSNPIEEQIEGLGLNRSQGVVTLGVNQFKILQKEFAVDVNGIQTETKKYTYLLWQGPRIKYLFEIYPQQSSTFDGGISHILQTFKSM